MSTWKNLVKKISKENKGKSLSIILKQASAVYKKMKKGGETKKMGGSHLPDITGSPLSGGKRSKNKTRRR